MAKQGTKRPFTWKGFINLEINSVRIWLFDNIKQADVAGYDLRFDFSKLHPDIKTYPEIVREAIGVGFEDSVRDAMALGADATNSQKRDAMLERGRYLESGAPQGWERKGVRGPTDTSLLYRVLEVAYPEGNARDILLEMYDDAKKQNASWEAYMAAILSTDELKPIAQKIREDLAKAKAKELVGSELLKGLSLKFGKGKVALEDKSEDAA